MWKRESLGRLLKRRRRETPEPGRRVYHVLLCLLPALFISIVYSAAGGSAASTNFAAEALESMQTLTEAHLIQTLRDANALSQGKRARVV